MFYFTFTLHSKQYLILADQSMAHLAQIPPLISQSQVENKGFIAFCSRERDADEFNVEVYDGDKKLGFLSMAYKPQVRRFRSVDAVAKVATKLGFSEVKIRLARTEEVLEE